MCTLAEALPADLKSHQRQLMTVARDILVGCEDTVWPIAAPSACVIVCALGEYLLLLIGKAMLHSLILQQDNSLLAS